MRVAAEHLLHNPLAVFVESSWEAAGLADPVLTGSIGGSICGLSTHSLIKRKRLGDSSYFLCWEHHWVMDLADNPFLHPVDELGGGDFCGLGIHEPSVGQTE